jgi:hypothetical protein
VGIQKPEIDRRRFDRYPVDYPISYVLEASNEISAGKTLNLGEGGLLVYFFDRINVGTELDLEMFYIHELQFTALNAQARIVWKDIMETSEAIEYQYGLEFVGMDREGKTRLCKLLESMKPDHCHPT